MQLCLLSCPMFINICTNEHRQYWRYAYISNPISILIVYIIKQVCKLMIQVNRTMQLCILSWPIFINICTKVHKQYWRYAYISNPISIYVLLILCKGTLCKLMNKYLIHSLCLGLWMPSDTVDLEEMQML